MKARIADELIAEILPDDYSGYFHEDTVIVDVPTYIEQYATSLFSFRYVDDAFTYEPIAFTKDLKDLIANLRWLNETGGVSIDGMPFSIPTTAEAQQKISAILQQYNNGVLDETETVDFVVGENTIAIGKDQILVINKAVARHVQSCFSRQAALYAEVDTWISAESTLEDIFTTFNNDTKFWVINHYDNTGALIIDPPASAPSSTPPSTPPSSNP